MDEQLHKYWGGKLNAKERASFLLRIKEDALLRQQFTQYQNLYALLDLLPAPNDHIQGQEQYAHYFSEKKKKPHTLFFGLIKYAAAILILVSSTWWITFTIYEHRLSVETNTLYVPPGQRACLTLHDGTTVWLNARSRLTYPSRFIGDKREVSLVGEAFFDVAKNASSPFCVSVKDLTVKVLGTEFNVLAYPESDYIQTSLLNGSVEVSSEKTNRKVCLSPDQEVIVRNGQMNVFPIKQHTYFLWKDGIYSFEQEKFESIIKKLELYYDTRIVVKNPEILTYVYTGKFRQQDGIDEILRLIQKIHHFKIDRDRENNIITLRK
ncbi:MAG: DUF4974 domain-containing protein [Massilibacteroides sp.]|nr:DUF4974 domain-containing protein [Massilibacteroides sp.]